MKENLLQTGILTLERLKPLIPYLKDERITDIDWDGSNLWVNTIDNETEIIKDHEVTKEYIETLAGHVANSQSKHFNKTEYGLEAETGDLRITCLHISVAISGTCMCIRKTTVKPRLNYEKLVNEKYCEPRILNLLINSLLAKLNIIICGEPEAGKTELAKWLAMYLPDNEKTVTIEDTPEWHYKALKPNANAIELRVNKNFSYVDAINKCMRLNPKRMMLSEVRSVEAMQLIEGWSTGVKGITTLHTDDVRKIPDRILNMMPTRLDAERLKNNVYENLDLGVMVRRRVDKNGKKYRCIDQVYFFDRINEENCIFPFYENGKFIDDIPLTKMKKFNDANCHDPFIVTDEMRLKKFEE